MPPVEDLAREITEIGFSCIDCGECCAGTGEDGSLVMVGRDEARRIALAARVAFPEAVEPYPGDVRVRGVSCRLGWAVARTGAGACRFHERGRCAVYAARPWICRTYPFMLDGERLVVSRCRGLGGPISMDTARSIATDLVRRRAFEDDEAERVRAVLETADLPEGEGTVVIDAEGVTRA
ncbi:MAG: YkgJ family cysteine cluster protein [Methanospirillum sp.]|nr:YkgJ family cysteine cluster protein [Methanospirillum sp.]